MTIIALVDDENSIRTSVSLALESEGFKVDVFQNGIEALEALESKTYDLGLFDIKPSVYNNLNEYKENNLLKEWKIINFNVKNKIDIEKAQDPFDPNEMKVYETDSVVIDIFMNSACLLLTFKYHQDIFLTIFCCFAPCVNCFEKLV